MVAFVASLTSRLSSRSFFFGRSISHGVFLRGVSAFFHHASRGSIRGVSYVEAFFKELFFGRSISHGVFFEVFLRFFITLVVVAFVASLTSRLSSRSLFWKKHFSWCLFSRCFCAFSSHFSW